MFTWKARVRAALARPQPGAPARVPGCCASLTQQPGRPAIKEHEVSQLEADRPVRWGIIATGGIAHAFARDLALLPDAEIAAVGSRSQASADAFTSEFGVARSYPSYADLAAYIREEDIKIIPKPFEKIYFHWIDNLRDWCVSRQIWWGHRIPVWYRTDTDGHEETYVGVQPPTDRSEGWHEWEQDPDTLDTWFSSALWTWSTLIDPALAADYSLSLDDLLEKSLDFRTY